MFIGGEGDLTLSRIRRPMFPIVATEHRTGQSLLRGHLRMVPFRSLKEELMKRERVNPGVSEGGDEVIPVATSETLLPTAGA